MQRWDLTRAGAASAVAATIAFVLGIVLTVSSGVQVLIPETGKNGLDWIRDVDDASGLFFAGGWLIVIGGVLGLVALVGFWEALRAAHPLLLLAPVLAVVGLVFVTISHAIPLALAYELPAYAWAWLKTKAGPRWIGWLGLASGAIAGWLGLLSPASSVIDGITFIGFVGFFVWLAATGISLLRRRGSEELPVPVVAH